MKQLLVSPVTPISPRATSHRGAQAEIYADQIERHTDHPVEVAYSGHDLDPSEYQVVYTYQGNDWGGSLNLFGGLDDQTAFKSITFFSRLKPEKIFSLAIKHPNYRGLFEERLMKSKSQDQVEKWHQVDWNQLDFLQQNAQVWERVPGPTAKSSIGDSHAICLYRPGNAVNSIPFKTLHGALDHGLINFWPIDQGSPEHVEFYFGNIDIRHHLCRYDSEETIRLAKEYVLQAEIVANLTKKGVSIYEPLPIENESRVVPKTGWYKGTPFYGSWEERNGRRSLFIDTLDSLKSDRVKIVHWTNYLTNSKGELDFKHMEKPRSVHLARSSYPYWLGRNSETKLETFA